MTDKKGEILLPREEDKAEDGGCDTLACLDGGDISCSYTWLTLQTSNRCFFVFFYSPKAPSGPLSAFTSARSLSAQRIDSQQLEGVCLLAVWGRRQHRAGDSSWVLRSGRGSFTPVPLVSVGCCVFMNVTNIWVNKSCWKIVIMTLLNSKCLDKRQVPYYSVCSFFQSCELN